MKQTGSGAMPAESALATSSERAYASDWAAFTSWCLLAEVASLPATMPDVVRYLSSLAATARISTLRRKLVAIGRNHRARGHAFPARDARMLAFFRSLGATPAARVTRRASTTTEIVAAMVAAMPGTIQGIRDRALVLVGWGLGCRPAELVGLDSEDMTVEAQAVLVRVRSSRRETREVQLLAVADLDVCPVRWLKSWLSISHVVTGPVFRPVTRFGRVLDHRISSQSVRLVLKRAAQRAGIAPASITGDSLRGPLPAPHSAH